LIKTIDSHKNKSLGGFRHQKTDMHRSDVRSWQLSLSILVVITFFFASTAYGHAIVISTTPGLRETVRGPDVPIRIQFTSRIDFKRSRLTLLAPDGKQTALGIVEASSEDSLISEAKGLKSGAYLLRWQVLANDGHITRGEIPFRVR
jgi:methionine-rich copper-binding protein CopC